jgi:RHS repeat-associated protein
VDATIPTSPPNPPAGGYLSEVFTYDSSHRLAGVLASGLYAFPSEAYGYDVGGNLTQKGSVALSYSVTGGGPHGVSGAHDSSTGVDVSYVYDSDGNVVQRLNSTSTTLEWDAFWYGAENRLLLVSTSARPGGNGSATYTYDESGSRVSRVVAKPGLAAENTITVDSDYEVDIARGKAKRHVFVGGRRVLTVETPSTASTPVHQLQYHADQLGTNRLITDETGAVVQRAFTKPFGELYKVVNGSGADVSPSNRASHYLFTGQHADVETALDYFGARYLDPLTGHFMSVDPELIGASAGATFNGVTTSPGAFDAYSYASNSPMTRVDRDGRQAVEVEPAERMEGAFEPFPEFWASEVPMEAPPLSVYTPEEFYESPGMVAPAGMLGPSLLSAPADACLALEPDFTGPFMKASGTAAGRGGQAPLVFRQGTFADEAVGWPGNFVKGKQWASDNPLTLRDFPKRYGLPSENATPDWVVGGRLRGDFRVQPAPASHNNSLNTGGAPEYLPTDPDDVTLEFFHMPD